MYGCLDRYSLTATIGQLHYDNCIVINIFLIAVQLLNWRECVNIFSKLQNA